MNRSLSIIAVLIVLAVIFIWMFNVGDRHAALKDENTTVGINKASVANLPTDFHSWNEYTAPKQEFKILVPNPPHHATEDIQDPKSHEMRNYQIFVSTKDDGALFSVYLISFPEKQGKNYDEIFLENFMNEMLKSTPTTTVKEIKMVPFREGKALDFDLETKDATILGKAFLKGKTLYILSETTKPDKKNPKEFEFFVNSFQLMQKTTPSDNIKTK